MSSGKLIPTRIVNKNGVSTTVHKRAMSFSAASVPVLPAPVSSADHLGSLVKVVSTVITGDERYRVAYEKKLASYQKSTLQIIVDNVVDSDTVWVEELKYLLVKDDVTERDVREYMVYSPVIESREVPTALIIIRGLRAMDELKSYGDFSEADSALKESYCTLLRLSNWAQENEPEERYSDGTGVGGLGFNEGSGELLPSLSRNDLVSVVIEYPERGDAIFKYVVERGFSGPENLLHYLNEEVHDSLREGTL